MPIVIDGNFRITIRWQMPDAVEAQSVWYAKVTAAGTGTSGELLDAWQLNHETAYAFVAPYISDGVSSLSAEIAYYDPGLGEWNTEATNNWTLLAGTSTADMAPHGNAPVVRFETATAKRQGRKFLPGMVESATTDSTLTGAAIAGLLSYGITADNPVSDQGTSISMGVWNPTLGFKGFSGTVLVNTITGYQRRRKPGVGI